MFIFCRIKRWRWTRDGCELREDTGYEGICACSVSGIFAIITDMYNINVSLDTLSLQVLWLRFTCAVRHIPIYNEFVNLIENAVPRVSMGHQEAPSSDVIPNSDRKHSFSCMIMGADAE